MPPTVTCTSSSVKIQKDGSLSGSCTITGSRTNISAVLATIDASGTPPKTSSPFSAGSNNGWSLSVTSDGAVASGSASGSWAGGDWEPNVPVSVDHPGKSRHKKKVPTKTASRSGLQARKKKAVAKARGSAVRRKARRR